eukprot:TRINITY_DN4184_c0_g1_i1.p1 TRINITY_DN4184_c0_g1~~TRINITY_DN4184_c0_g1_i1.p1  ORF type:complete len:1578 (-),score=172.29 TRINITY_DN4184_c0_g1_i1:7757-12490(-)
MEEESFKNFVLDRIHDHSLTIKQAFNEFAAKHPSAPIDSVLSLADILLYGTKDIAKGQAEVYSVKFPVGVCGKLIDSFDVVYTCVDCSVIDNSVYCSECFKKELHAGHKVRMSTGSIGCCDCGDPEAVIPTSFCPLHKGFREEYLQPELLPPHTRMSYEEVLTELATILANDLVNYLAESEKGAEYISESSELEERIQKTIGYFKELLNISPFFLKVLGEILNQRMYTSTPLTHTCSPFITSLFDEEAKHKAALSEKTEKDPKKKICACKVTQLLIRAGRDMHTSVSSEIYDFLVNLSKSAKFKIFLCQSYVTNYPKILETHKMDHLQQEDSFRKLGLQALSFDDTALFFLENPILQQIWTKTLAKLLKSIKGNLEQSDVFFRMHIFALDLTYILKKKAACYMVYKSDLIKRYLDCVEEAELEQICIPVRYSHIEYGFFNKDINLYYLFTSKNLIRIFKRIIINYDFWNDTELCHPLGVHFRNLLHKQYLRYCETKDLANSYFYMNDLHKCFSLFLSYYVNTRILHNYSSSLPNWVDIKMSLRNLLKNVLGLKSDTDLNAFIIQTLEIACRPMTLILEEISRRWIYYGELMAKFTDIYMDTRKGTSCDLDLGLIQILLAAYDGDDLIEVLCKVLDPSNWVIKYLSSLEEGGKEKYHQIGEHNFDKFARQMEVFLFFLCGLCSNDETFYKPLMRLNSPIEVPREHHLKEVTQHFIRRTIIHLLFKSKNATSSFYDIIQKFPKKFRENPEIEKMLGILCDSNVDYKGHTLFALKPETLSEYDPYFYCVPYHLSECYDNAQALCDKYRKQQEDMPFDLLIGRETPANLLSYVPNLVIANLLKSGVLKYIPDFVREKNFPFEVEGATTTTNEGIRIAALKILSMFVANYGTLSVVQKNKFVTILIKDDMELLKSLKAMSIANKNYQNTIETLLAKLKEKVPNPEIATFIQEEMETQTKISKEQLNKQKLKELQDKIMQDFKKKQQHFAEKNQIPEPKVMPAVEEEKGSDFSHQKLLENESTSTQISGLGEQCTLCRETLNTSKPYGRIAYIGKSSLIYKSAVYTIKKVAGLSKEKEAIDLLPQLGLSRQNGGLRASACNHFVHFDCSKNFKRQDLSFEHKEFVCPVCQMISTCVVPPAGLTFGETGKDFIESLSKNYGDMLSPLNFATFVQRLIVHNILLIDVMGISEFMKVAELYQSIASCAKEKLSANQKECSELKSAWVSKKSKRESFGKSKNIGKDLSKWAIKEYLVADYYEGFKAELAAKVELAMYATIILNALRRLLPKSASTKITQKIILEEIATSDLYKEQCLPELRKFAALYSILSNKVPQVKAISEKLHTIKEEFELLSSGVRFNLSKCRYYFEHFAEIAEEKDVLAVSDAIEAIPVCPFKYNQALSGGLQFGLVELPERFADIILQYCPKPCAHCGKQVREKAVCLLCGNVYCWPQYTIFSDPNACHQIAIHAMNCGGDGGVFLSVYSGEIILYSITSVKWPSPYINKFGEPLDRMHYEHHESYSLNSKAYKELEQMVLQDKIPNIVKSMSNMHQWSYHYRDQLIHIYTVTSTYIIAVKRRQKQQTQQLQ